jgi:predicted GTPase
MDEQLYGSVKVFIKHAGEFRKQLIHQRQTKKISFFFSQEKKKQITEEYRENLGYKISNTIDMLGSPYNYLHLTEISTWPWYFMLA